MIGALWTGISGLAAQQTALDNEAHNIANVNTVGYKSSRISFADQMYQDKIGKGSKIMDAEKIYTQGNLKVTGVSYDLALSGQGFFAMAEANATGSAEIFYTRAGNFRMGDNGNFQDAAGNEVQGWAMRDIDPATDATSTNPNVTFYNSDYTKLVTSKVIKHSNFIETISAKTTDYTLTAKADTSSIYSGSSLKSQANKISDVEELIKSYSAAVQSLSENPDGSSATSTAQVSYVDFPDDGSGAMTKDGDEVYIYIDSVKYATSWDNDYNTTMKNLADIISKIPGFKATMTNDGSPTIAVAGLAGVTGISAVTAWADSTTSGVVGKGVIKIESMVPGDAFTISELAAVSGTTIVQGSIVDVNTAGTKVVVGSGKGAIESARDALSLAVAGKQNDVYTIADDLGTLGVPLAGTITDAKDFTYTATVYDNATEANITISSISISDPTSIDDMVTDLNADTTFATHLEAVNINNTLVIRTLDSNADVEFSGTMTSDITVPTLAAGTLTSTSITTFSTDPTPTADGVRDFTFAATAAESGMPSAITSFTITAPADMTALAAAINANTEVQAAYGGSAPASVNSNGELVMTDLLTAGTNTTFNPLDVVANTAVEKNATSSGREGAGAELLELATAIDQTASRGSLQLRLDTLGISDSAFGEFSVDTTGLITMKQDGAEFAIGQIAIAMFNNNRGLNPSGNNLLQKTNESGDAIYNLNNAKAATIEGGTLELSEADLSESLVNLMVFQRAFEANAKSITSADELLNTLINLKR